MNKFIEKTEAFMELGGIRKDIALAACHLSSACST